MRILAITIFINAGIFFPGYLVAQDYHPEAFKNSLRQGVTGANAGQFTMTNSGTLHFLEFYFYSDSACTILLTNGVASYVSHSTSESLTNGPTYSFDSQSIYSAANTRNVNPADIQCMAVYMDGGNESPNGINCMKFTETCDSTNGCVSHSSTQSATWGASPSICQTRYAYITEFSSSSAQPVTICTVESSGTLDNCTTTGEPSFKNATLGNTPNNGYLYISNGSSATNSVSASNVDPASSGALSSPSSTLSSLAAPKSIAIDGTNAYIIHSGTTAYLSVINTDGSLGTPTTTGSNFETPIGITISNNYAYITNNAEGTYSTGFISICSIGGGGALSCSAFNDMTIDSPKGIAAYNGYVFIVNNSSMAIPVIACLIDANGSLSGCADSGATHTLFDSPQGIVINQGYAYITNLSNNTVIQCTVNGATLSSCTNIAGITLTSPVGISIY